jgi:ribosomal protein S20
MQMAQKQRTHIEDLEARQRQSEMTIEAARIRAEAGQGRRDEKALQAIGPALRTIAEQYPDGTANSLLGASPDDKRKIAGSFRAIDESEIAADFVARNPRAVGALAVIKNYLKIDSIKGIKNDDESAAASQKAAFIDSEIDKQVSKKLISKDDAEAAKLLQKKLFALALSDVQGSGQRGSVYLDRQFQNLYDQASRPQTLLKIIQERAAENNRNLRLYKLNVERNNNPENFPLYESDTQDRFNKYLKDRQPVASLNDVADTAKSNKITTEVAKKRLKDMGYRIEGEQ